MNNVYLPKEDYLKAFEGKNKEALERAWLTRNFEIELYWKRATYFWAFLVPIFTGYFLLVNNVNYAADLHEEVYMLICLGFMISVGWIFINKGSKSWQNNWEFHIDMLENDQTGPLYKCVHKYSTFSVTKINELISYAFAVIWVLLGCKYLNDKKIILNCHGTIYPYIAIPTLSVLIFIILIFTYGSSHVKDRTYSMYKRSDL